MGAAGLASPFFFFVAFLLLLLVTLSTPIIKSIWLFDIVAQANLGEGVLGASTALGSVHDTVKFGIFGWCSSAVAVKVLTFNYAKPAVCSPRHLGFTVSPELEQALSAVNEAQLVSTIQKALSVVLILHPIACAITFLALLFSILAILLRKTRLWDLLATGTGIVAAVLSSIVFIIDIVFCAIAKSKLHTKTQGIATVNWGNAVWLTLVAAILTWIAIVGACCGVIRGRRERKQAERY